MNARARRTARRSLRATLRQRRLDNRATHRATKAVATGKPQAASTHLIAAGITPTDAKRYAGAFSRGVVADSTAKTTVKLKGRRTKKVTVKLYNAATFALRLATYRPRDKAAAARFEQAAHSLSHPAATADNRFEIGQTVTGVCDSITGTGVIEYADATGRYAVRLHNQLVLFYAEELHLAA